MPGPNAPGVPRVPRPAFRAEFDDELAERQRLSIEPTRAAGSAGDFVGDADFQEEWFGEDDEGNSLHEVGLRGGWDAATRDKELDRDGVTAEVVFPGPDAVTGTMGAPVRRRLQPGRHAQPRAPARRRAGLQPVGRRAVPGERGAARRPDRRADPRRPRRRHRRDPPRPRRRAHRGRDHPAAVGRPRVVHQLPLRPGVGGVRGARAPGALPLGSRAAGGLRRGQRVDERLRLRDDVLHRAPAVVHAPHRRVRAVPAGSRWPSPRPGASGPPTCCGAPT